MSANYIDLLKNCVKPCFVLLERLDENIVQQYMQKQESNLRETTSGVTSPRPRRRRRGCPPKKCSKAQRKKEYASSSDQIPRKRSRRTKPLCYSEDKWGFTASDGNEVVTKQEVKSLFLGFDEGKQQSEKISQVKRPILAEEMNCVDESNGLSKCKETGEEEVEEESKWRFESEAENMEEFGMSAVAVAVKSEVVCDLMPKEELGEEEEGELPNKSEDERETVIFDESFNDDTKEEVFERAEKRVKNENKRLKKKKIMNRKKRKLVKFKRKRSMMGRNLAKVKKLTKKSPEVRDCCQDVAERESCLSEICSSVKRLHELHVIISHLQVHLPKDPEQADHFIKTIRVQRENFHSEIIKNHKAIVSGCKRLLSFYGSSNKVTCEIRKRTFLRKKDVADVLSWCSVMEMVGEKNRRKETGEQKLNFASQEGPPEGFGVDCSSEKPKRPVNHNKEGQLPLEAVAVQREKNLGLTQDAVVGAIPASAPPPCNPSENRSIKPPQKPFNNLKMARDSTAKNNSRTVQVPSEHFVRAQQFSRNSSQDPWDLFSKPRTYFSPQKCYNQRTTALMRDPRGWQMPQDPNRIVPRGLQMNYPRFFRVQNEPSIPRNLHRGCGFPPQGGGPGLPTNYAPNYNLDHWPVPGAFMFSAPQLEMPESTRPPFSIPSLMSLNNFPRMNLVYQYSQPLNSASSTAFCPQPLRQNFYEPAFDLSHSMRTSRGPHATKCPNAPRKRSKKTAERNAPNEPSSGKSCPAKPPVTVPTECLQPAPEARAQTHAVGEAPLVTEKAMSDANDPEEGKSNVLDPTVPQKLTLKNHRLEAGPVLRVKKDTLKERDSVNTVQWHRPVKGEELVKDNGGPKNVLKKESRSRVYMCAQNKCKKPGIQICKGCRSIIYCSVTCQLQHWNEKHKNECHQLKELRGCEVKSEV